MRTIAELLNTLINIKSSIKASIEKSGLVWDDTHTTDAGTDFTTYAFKINTIVDNNPSVQSDKTYYINGDYETTLYPDEGYNLMSTITVFDELSSDIDEEEPTYDGNVDADGLRQIGWTDEDIAYLQSNVWWNTEDDGYWAVSRENIELYQNAPKVVVDEHEMAKQTSIATFKASSACRYMPKTDLGTLTSLSIGSKYIYAIPKLNVTTTIKSLSSAFSGSGNLRSIDVSEYDTRNVTSMSSTFGTCVNLRHIDVSNWNTSKVTSMSSMFSSCENLKDVDVSGFDTSNVTSFTNMFIQCVNLKSLDVSNWNTGKVTNMQKTFQRCYRLQNLDVSNWNVSNVTTMDNMFMSCKKLRKLDLTNWNTPKLTVMTNMFQSCELLVLTGIENLNVSKVTNFQYLFAGMSSQQELDLSNWNTSSVTNMTNMFINCIKLRTLNISGLDTSSVTNMGSMFSGCEKLTELDLTSFNTSKVTTMANMFYECFSLRRLDFSGFDFSAFTASSSIPMFTTQRFAGDFNTVKSILTCAKNSTMSFSSPKLQFFNACSVYDDDNGTIQSLVDECNGNGWTITNLYIG